MRSTKRTAWSNGAHKTLRRRSRQRPRPTLYSLKVLLYIHALWEVGVGVQALGGLGPQNLPQQPQGPPGHAQRNNSTWPTSAGMHPSPCWHMRATPVRKEVEKEVESKEGEVERPVESGADITLPLWVCQPSPGSGSTPFLAARGTHGTGHRRPHQPTHAKPQEQHANSTSDKNIHTRGRGSMVVGEGKAPTRHGPSKGPHAPPPLHTHS